MSVAICSANEQSAVVVDNSLYPSLKNVPSVRPKLIVFDLDNTLWTPELYQIRQRDCPRVEKDISLFPGARVVLDHFAAHTAFWQETTQLAVASRTSKSHWANQLLEDFRIEDGMTTLLDLFPLVCIQTGSKKKHFRFLKDATGIAYTDMVFFDDDVHMNLREIEQLGVLCSHCPRGLTADLFVRTLEEYARAKTNNDYTGYIVNAKTLGIQQEVEEEEEGTVVEGVVKFFNPNKRFGFVRDNKKEYFFHESKIPQGLRVTKGTRVRFETMVDGKGRPSAAILELVGNNDMLSMPCFTMSQPFASLLLNGIKTVETRNNDMFTKLEPGTRVLLHCGRRDWRDMEAPRIELRKAGYTEEDIDRLSALPRGFARGSIIGVMTVGETWQSTKQERQKKQLQRKVISAYQGIGVYCTPITEAKWLKRALPTKGNAGIYSMQIPKDLLPSL